MIIPEKKFIEAAGSGDIGTVRAYLEAGGNVNAQDEYQSTALHSAARNTATEIILLLLDHKASIKICDKGGKSPLDIARSHNGGDVYKIFKIEETIQSTPRWSLFGEDQLAHSEVSRKLERRLSEIFNFESRERLKISENLATGAEIIVSSVSFDDLNEPTLKKALGEFRKLGGVADEDFILRGNRVIKIKNI